MKKVNLVIVVLILLLSSHATRASQPRTQRIVSYNIRNCIGMDNIRNFDRVADVLNTLHPAVVAVQEIDSFTNRSGKTDVLKELGKRTHMHHLYAPAINYDGGKYGIGILSKELSVSHQCLALPGREEERVLLIVEFKKYVFACTHLSLTEEDRMNSLNIIRAEAKKAKKPFILAGDLNAEPESPFMKELQKDFQLLTNPEQLTVPASEPDACIDYIVVCNSGKEMVTLLANDVVNEPMASDHRPVWVDIKFK